ncbi:hypothetical protein DBR42_04620 [Pelomonas sp. HMWF004]|nr:hypothetical protein DBR42_04620 [Pelomonas sp. HMWF004]
MESNEKQVEARLAIIELALSAAINADPALREFIVKSLGEFTQKLDAEGLTVERSLLNLLTAPPSP